MYDITTLISTLLLLSLSLTCLYAHSGPYFLDILRWHGIFYSGMGIFMVAWE